MQEQHLQSQAYTKKNRKYNSYKGTVGKIAPNQSESSVLKQIDLIRSLQSMSQNYAGEINPMSIAVI